MPRWSVAPGRFLERWWFVSPYRSLHASALVDTPAAFANRGVFIQTPPSRPARFLLEELFA